MDLMSVRFDFERSNICTQCLKNIVHTQPYWCLYLLGLSLASLSFLVSVIVGSVV